MSEYLTDEDYWYELKERDLPLIQKRIYDCIGYEAYESLVRDYGGSSIYIPTAVSVTKEIIQRKIAAEYEHTHMKYRLLADKYGVGEYFVSQAIRKYHK